jgi:nucleoside-diphosphate-sugar epimerase
MRVFVAGASGGLGGRLVPQLSSAGHEVLGTNNSPATAERLRQLGPKSVVVDLVDARAVGNAVLDSQPEAIVHLDAAKPAFRESLGALHRVTLVTLATRPARKPHSSER